MITGAPVGLSVQASRDWLGGPDWAVLVLESAGDIQSDQIIDIVTEQNEGGRYLEGAHINTSHVKTYFKRTETPACQMEYFDYDMRQEKTPYEVIKTFLQTYTTHKRFIYYTGHGDSKGRWCFTLNSHKGQEAKYFSAHDMAQLIKLFPSSKAKDIVFSQCCHSGHWCDQQTFSAISSADHRQLSVSDTSSGSYVTRRFFGKSTSALKSSPICNWSTGYEWAYLVNDHGMILAVIGNKKGAGYGLCQWHYPTGEDLGKGKGEAGWAWKLTSDGYLENALGYVLAVNGNSSKKGTLICQYSKVTGEKGQQWAFEPRIDGKTRLKNKHDKYLAVAGNSNSTAAQICQWSMTPEEGQFWHFEAYH